jgi:hypothetical protein
MKAFSKLGALAILLAALGLGYFAGIYAQQVSNESSAPPTTNWTGYLVVGTDETIDHMPLQQAHPKTVAQVEIGLRSDGVVVWRGDAPKTK